MTELVSLNFLEGDRTLDLDPSQLYHGGSDLREGGGREGIGEKIMGREGNEIKERRKKRMKKIKRMKHREGEWRE